MAKRTKPATPRETLQLAVRRVSHEEITFAIVRCTATDKVPNVSHVRRAIEAAVTEWVKTTQDGKDAYNRSAADFNVGDLSTEDYQSGELNRILREHGIDDLDIEVEANQHPQTDWTYDMHLVDDTQLDEDDPS
mgnify:CR=1